MNTVDSLRSLNSQVSVPSWSGLVEVGFDTQATQPKAFTVFQSNPSFI